MACLSNVVARRRWLWHPAFLSCLHADVLLTFLFMELYLTTICILTMHNRMGLFIKHGCVLWIPMLWHLAFLSCLYEDVYICCFETVSICLFSHSSHWTMTPLLGSNPQYVLIGRLHYPTQSHAFPSHHRSGFYKGPPSRQPHQTIFVVKPCDTIKLELLKAGNEVTLITGRNTCWYLGTQCTIQCGIILWYLLFYAGYLA